MTAAGPPHPCYYPTIISEHRRPLESVRTDTAHSAVRTTFSRPEGASSDQTEDARRQILAQINAAPGGREGLEAKHGQVWRTEKLVRDFIVIGFSTPLVGVRRKGDGVQGRLVPAKSEVLLRV